MTGQDKTPASTPGKPAGEDRTRATPVARGDVRRETGKQQPPSADSGRRARGRRAGDVVAGSRPERYLVAAAPPAEAHALAAQLRQDPQISVMRMIGRAFKSDGYPPIAVIETTPERAAELARVPTLHVEPDQRLGCGAVADRDAGDIVDSLATRAGEPQQVVITVEDDGGHPLSDAAVCLSGQGLPAVGFTGSDGRAELTVAAETAAGPELLFVRPARGCWPTRVIRPHLPAGDAVTVRCDRIVTTFPGFPDQALRSWGAEVMGFGMLPPTHRGQGVRIALIGSGAAATHPDLVGRLAHGRDVAGEDDQTWREDLIGTGTHQAVLIGGQDDGTGVNGLAPEAEVHICRTAPGGTCADLIDALDYCIEQGVDVALMSAGMTEDSMLLAAKISQARQYGIACIAAAGDGGREIARPAAMPGVLAVGALGQLGTFPCSSGIASQLTGPVAADGLFAPRFANHGPGLDCCAPGVAVVSGLPPASYGPLSSTGIAAAHVAAAAVLVLAHHPEFRPERNRPAMNRDAGRVDRLFQLILASCRPLPAIGPLRSGAGLPNVPAAVGVTPWETLATAREFSVHPAASQGSEDPVRAAFAPLEAAMQSAGLIPARPARTDRDAQDPS
ncbi:MAG: S8 family serine peptidase [Streptosporangiaceae bacterium]